MERAGLIVHYEPHRLPTVTTNRHFYGKEPTAGDLRLRRYVRSWRPHGLWTDLADMDRRAAIYVDKILKGAKPADLP